MTLKFKLDLYFTMLYPYVNFGWNCCIPSKVIDRKQQFSHNLSQKRAKTIKIQQMTSLFEHDLYLIMFYSFAIFEKVIDQKPKM